MKTEQLYQPRHNSQLSIKLCIIFIGVLVVGFSPHLSFFLLVAALLLAGKFFDSSTTKLIALISILSASICIGSRESFIVESDDLPRNYAYYELFLQGEYKTVFENTASAEFLYYTYVWVIAVVLPELTPSGLIVVFCVTIGFAFLFSVRRLIDDFPLEKRAYATGVLLLFFSFFTASQLVRQMLASSILVAALLEPKRYRSIGYLIFAFFIHNFALLGYMIGITFMRLGVKYSIFIALSAAAILFSIIFNPGLLANPVVEALGGTRLGFWNETIELSNVIISMENIILAFVTFFAVRQAILGNGHIMQRYLVGCSILWFALLPLPYFSLRICVVLRTMLLGYYIVKTFDRQRLRLHVIIAAYFVFRFFKLAYFSSAKSGFDLWEVYGFYSPSYMYFLRFLFA